MRLIKLNDLNQTFLVEKQSFPLSDSSFLVVFFVIFKYLTLNQIIIGKCIKIPV